MERTSGKATLLSRMRRQAVAICALVIVLGSTAYAAVTVTGRNIRDGTVAGIDIRNNSVTGKDVRARSLGRADFRPGSLRRGSQGLPGPAGPAFSTYHDTSIALPDAPGLIASLAIPEAGSYFVIANATAYAPADPGSVDCEVVAVDAAGSDADRQEVFPRNYSNLTPTVVHTYSEPGFVRFTCSDDGTGAELSNIKITAVRTGSLTSEPF